MLLSEAILLGSTMLKPIRGTIYETSLNGQEFGCALGMAYKALGCIKGGRLGLLSTLPFWPTLSQIVQLPCGCTKKPQQLNNAIAHLFDHHVEINGRTPRYITMSGRLLPELEHWTLEQLVDWVRSQEEPQAESTVNEETKETICSV